MSRTKVILNWENDMIQDPEPHVVEFAKKHYPNLDLQLMSGLRHRHIDEIRDSLKDSMIIIMQPHLIDPSQIALIAQSISHSIHGAFCGASREWDLRDFVFLSVNPWETCQAIIEACSGLKDNVGEDPLVKIVKHIQVQFYGFDGEHYELKISSHWFRDLYVVRYK